MKLIIPLVLLLALAACGDRQVPMVNGVPVTGQGVGGGAMIGGGMGR